MYFNGEEVVSQGEEVVSQGEAKEVRQTSRVPVSDFVCPKKAAVVDALLAKTEDKYARVFRVQFSERLALRRDDAVDFYQLMFPRGCVA